MSVSWVEIIAGCCQTVEKTQRQPLAPGRAVKTEADVAFESWWRNLERAASRHWDWKRLIRSVGSFGFLGTSRCFPSASLQDPAEETKRERKWQRSASSSRPCWQQKPEISSALCLWLPWKHISVCCRTRCHRNCFHFIMMLCYVQESINKMQVGGTWLCLRTGNSSFSCSKITVTLRVCVLFGLLSEVCLLWILLWRPRDNKVVVSVATFLVQDLNCATYRDSQKTVDESVESLLQHQTTLLTVFFTAILCCLVLF